MPCYRPLHGWLSRTVNPSGKRSIVFCRTEGFTDMPVTVPCGRCIGCRLDRSRSWAVRCIHESHLYEDNCFITLTFDDEHLAKDYSLHVDDFQRFIKRLRKKFAPLTIRYFHCGEYGDMFERPHHHALLFNFNFPDREYLGKTPTGDRLYTSNILDDLWSNGLCSIGEVTFDSAAYVARYCIKKLNGDLAEQEYFERSPEILTMSRKPGIGEPWLKKFHKDVYPDDFVVLPKGHKVKTPRYYDLKYDLINPEILAKIKAKRKKAGKDNPDNSGDRLDVRETVQEVKAGMLKRRLE